MILGKNSMSPSKFHPTDQRLGFIGAVHVAETLPSEGRVDKDGTCILEVNT